MRTIARGQVSFLIAEKGDDSYFISLNPSPLVMSDEVEAASAGGSGASSLPAMTTPWYEKYESLLKVKLGENYNLSSGAYGTAPTIVSGQETWPAGYPIHVKVGATKNADGTTNSNITFAYRHQTITEEEGVHLLKPYHKHSIYISQFNDTTITDGYVDIDVTIVDAPEVPVVGHEETELYSETVRLYFSVARDTAVSERISAVEQSVVTGSVEMRTTAEWDAATGYIPVAGKVIVYSDHDTKQVVREENGENVISLIPVPGIKIGDGLAYVQDLPFVDDVLSAALAAHIANGTLHTSQVEKLAWNNKLNVDDSSEVVNESLVFNRN